MVNQDTLQAFDGKIQTNTMEHDDDEFVGQAQRGPLGKLFSDKEGNLIVVNWVVACPCFTMCTMIMLCIAMTTALALVLVNEGGNPITDDKHNYDVFDVRSKHYDSFRLAKEFTDDARDEQKRGDVVELRQSDAIDIIYWIYEAETENGMFSSDALDDIKAAEAIFLENEQWHEFCVRDHFLDNGTQIDFNSTECAKPLSPITIFFPDSFDTVAAQEVVDAFSNAASLSLYSTIAPCLEFGIQCTELLVGVTSSEEAEMRLLVDKINAITSQWTGKGDKVHDPELVQLFCAYMKEIPTRAPLVDFFFDHNFNVSNPKSMYTRSVLRFGGPRQGYNTTGEGESEQGKEIKDYVLDYLFDDMDRVSKGSYSDESNTFYFMTQLLFDVFVQILLRDTTAAAVSVLSVFIYIWIMVGSLFLAAVGMLEILLSIPCAWFIFRVLFQIEYFSGLNALTIFIVCAIGADDIFVFWEAYRESASKGPAVNRNLQTRLSWVWRKAGLAMAITSATTCCAFLCTLATPIAGTRSFGIFAALVIFWDYVLVMSLFCTAVVVYHNHFERRPACSTPCCGCCTENCACNNQNPSPTDEILRNHANGSEVKPGRVPVFFATTFADFVLSTPGRVIIWVVAIAWLVPALWFVTRLEPIREEEQFLASDHPLQYSITIINEQFPASAESPGLRTFFVWGVDTLDQSGVNQLLDDDFIGTARLKDDFSFSPACQTAISRVCQKLRYAEDANGRPNAHEGVQDLIKRDDTGFYSVRCVFDSFHAESDNRGLLNADRTVHAENLTAAIDQYLKSPPLEVEDIALIQENLGFDGQRVRWVSVEVEAAALDRWSTLPESEVRAVYDGFLGLAGELDEEVGGACGARGVLMTDLEQKFVFMNNQRIYRTGAVLGAMIGGGIAFAVLLLATRSLPVALLSTGSILCTMVSVIGVVTMMGWSLGTVESILISILAGFSVDYVVHLAHAFSAAVGTTQDRVRAAFGEMGTPVLSGMLTSVLASLPLFTCQIVFFAKFGAFLCFTILFSWLSANFLFMSAWFRMPEGEQEEKVDVKPETQNARGSKKAKPAASKQAERSARSTRRVLPVIVSNEDV